MQIRKFFHQRTERMMKHHLKKVWPLQNRKKFGRWFVEVFAVYLYGTN
jgi:hypothetical protein